MKNRYIKYTISFIFCIGLILSIFIFRRTSLIGDGDSFNQAYPVFIYIGEYLRSILQGDFKTFDFRIGFGEDIISVLNYYGFGDIFSVLSAFFSIKLSEEAYNLVMLLKLYFCGITFLVYAKRYIKNDNVIISGALMYALSVFVLFRGMGFWMFINPIFLYPLILCGIDEICIENKKISWILIWAVCLQTLNGFYFLYINAILSIIYFFVITLCRTNGIYEKTITLLKKATAILGQTSIGISAGAVIFIPGILGYFNSSRTSRSEVFERIQDYFFYSISFYFNNLKSLLIPNVWESITTMPVMIILACMVAFVSKKIHSQFKVLLMCVVILYNIPFWGSVMNGFSEVSDRWYYAVILFLIILGCLGIENVKSVPNYIKYIFLATGLVVVCSDIIANGMVLQVIFRDVLLYVCMLVSLYLYKCKNQEKIILPWTCILLILNGLLIMGPNELGGNGYSWAFMPKGKTLQDMIRSVEDVEIRAEDEFQRIDVYGASLGTSLVKDYYGTSEYFSILNNHVSEFYQELSISPGLRSASWILKGIDGREEIMSLLSVNQYIDFVTEGTNVNSNIKKNEYYIPFGFTYDKWISRDEFGEMDPLQKQKIMIEGVVIEDEITGYSNLLTSNNKLKNKSVDYSVQYSGVEKNNKNIKTKQESRMRIYVETNENRVYVYFKDFFVCNSGVHEILVGNKNLQLRNENDGYYMGVDDFLINVTELKEKNGKKYFDIVFLEDCEFLLGLMEVYEHIVDTQVIESRKENVLQSVEWNKNQLTGNISVDEPKILFLSIPYSKGWKAYLNGEETAVLQANIAFTAIELPGGDYDICLKYETPGMKAGLLCSTISILIMLYIKMKSSKRKSR